MIGGLITITITATAPPALVLTRTGGKRILAIGLPIVGGMLSQNVLDLADTIMVGQLGAVSLAAVGLAAFVSFVASALLIGLAAGVQAVVARRKGEGRTDEQALPLNGGLLVALLGAIPIAILGVVFAADIYPPLVSFNPDVVAEGVPYLQARLAGVVAIALNFSFRGYWYGIGETGTSLRIIVSIHILNILISYGLIFGHWGLPALGTLGAGLGTTIALCVGTVAYALVTYRRARPEGFLRALPSRRTFSSLMRLSIPSAIQTLLFALGLTTLFVIAGTVSVAALAVSNVLVHVSKVAALPAMGFGFAAMTLVSEALGQRSPEAANRWAWQTVQVAMIFIAVVAVTLFTLPQTIFEVFTDDPRVVSEGIVPLRILAVTVLLEAVGAVMMQTLIGAGAARIAMLTSVAAQWLVGLPLAYFLAVEAGFGVVGIWVGFGVFRLIATTALTTLWLRGGWRTITL